LSYIGVDEGARHGDAQPALELLVVLAHQVGKVVDFLQYVGCGAIIGMARLGHGELPRGAVEQQRTEIVFQFPDIFGQQRLGAAGLAGCGRKPFRFDHVDEGADPGQSVHGDASR
jgi:hypothetical protein